MTFQHIYLGLVASAFAVFILALLGAAIWSRGPRA